MASIVTVTNTNSNNLELPPSKLNRLKLVGGFRNAVLEASGMYQKMINQGALPSDIRINIFEYGSEKLLAISDLYEGSYHIQGVAGLTNPSYEDTRILNDPSTNNNRPVFKKLPTKE